MYFEEFYSDVFFFSFIAETQTIFLPIWSNDLMDNAYTNI